MRPGLVDDLMSDPKTLVLAVSRGRVLAAEASGELAFLRPDDVPKSELLIYLGRSMTATDREPAGTAFVAAVLDDAVAERLAPDDRWANLRVLGAVLGDRDAHLCAEAIAMANWHASHRFSPLTGRPLRSEQAGWVLVDGDTSMQVFPRTDPAVIVAVTDAEDRLLLGSNALWESNRYSLLAGFVEPGESLEAAVIREVFEESGIRVIDPVYLSSQPWPFPQSLMLGFHARVDPAVEQQLRPDGEEILDARWFSRDDLRSASDIILPGRTSIARMVIEDWLGAPIEDDRW